MKRIVSFILLLAILCSAGGGALAEWGSSWDWGTGSEWGSNSSTYTGSTNLFYASSAQMNNINIAASRLQYVYVGEGETFSFNDIVGPRTETYGFKSAVNGRGVKARGGGVGQVATTLYLALKQVNGIQFSELQTWGTRFAQSYTVNGNNAVIVDYHNGYDLCFRNNVGGLTIEMWVSRSYLYCTVTVDGSSWGTQTENCVGYSSILLKGTSTLKNNVRLAAESVNGTYLSYYGEFSFNRIVGPRTQNNGYGNAINGRGVQNMGGGVAQVASAIWMAIKDLDSVTMLEKKTYGYKYNQSYVQSGEDAIVTDYAAGTDFRFRYRGYGELVIYTYISSDGTRLVCEVYERY